MQKKVSWFNATANAAIYMAIPWKNNGKLYFSAVS
jgi:hypothetical protein